MHILNNHNGYLPIKIKAVPEGSLIPTGNVLMTIESTDAEVFWIVSFVETLLMKIWYPSTVATKSYYVRKMLEDCYSKYSDNSDVSFSYHNFGDRGSTTVEAAAIGGVAQLTQFMGTDNFNSLRYAKHYYNSDIAGFSIPASEHSTVTSWTKDGEFNMIDNYLEKYKNSPIIACVLDSYDIYNAVDKVTSGVFKEKIESSDYPIFVMRPDSGDPIEVVIKMLDIMEKNSVSFSINSKGLKVFNKYRIIYGDGISPEIIEKILGVSIIKGYAPDNFAFGSGGDLMQNLNRDTSKYAIKCSAVNVNSKMIDVYKDPITDKGKTSKKGILDLVYNGKEYKSTRIGTEPEGFKSVLRTVYENGKLIIDDSLEDIRKRSK